MRMSDRLDQRTESLPVRGPPPLRRRRVRRGQMRPARGQGSRAPPVSRTRRRPLELGRGAPGLLRRERSEPPGERPRERARPLPPFVRRGGDVRRRQLAHMDIGQAGLRKQAAEPGGIVDENGCGIPGGGIGAPRWAPTTSNTTASHGSGRAAPDGENRPSTRTEDTADLSCRRAGSGRASALHGRARRRRRRPARRSPRDRAHGRSRSRAPAPQPGPWRSPSSRPRRRTAPPHRRERRAVPLPVPALPARTRARAPARPARAVRARASAP